MVGIYVCAYRVEITKPVMHGCVPKGVWSGPLDLIESEL
jgi:hypothetical protein